MKDLKLDNFGKIGKTKAEEKKPSYVKASLVCFPDDLEFYKDFVYHQKGSTGNFRYGHKEAMQDIVKLLKKKFPNVEPRPDEEREREQFLGAPKKG